MEGEKEENITFNHSYSTQYNNRNTINYFLKRIHDGSIIRKIYIKNFNYFKGRSLWKMKNYLKR